MTYFLIGLVVAGGAMIQGAIGFAFGIFSIPLLVWIGLPLEEAITLVLGLVVIQTLASVWQNLANIPWSDVLAISIPRFFAVVVGVSLLGFAKQRWSPAAMKQMIGACLIVVILTQLWIRPQPRDHIPKGWTWFAGSISGLMAGLIGMGGPAVVLWVMAHNWSGEKSRTLMWCVFSFMVPWQLAVNYHRFGWPVIQSAVLGMAYIPVVIVATMIGTRIGNRMSQDRLRMIAYSVLISVGLTSIIGPWLSR